MSKPKTFRVWCALKAKYMTLWANWKFICLRVLCGGYLKVMKIYNMAAHTDGQYI